VWWREAPKIFPARFAGKVAVVTGAAQGIGRNVALRFAREAGRLALVDRSPPVEVRCEAVAVGAEPIAIVPRPRAVALLAGFPRHRSRR
jgi:NAD(P)-dependent dehydrogenase (short-subunit alcohol dehydrogenase family)